MSHMFNVSLNMILLYMVFNSIEVTIGAVVYTVVLSVSQSIFPSSAN